MKLASVIVDDQPYVASSTTRSTIDLLLAGDVGGLLRSGKDPRTLRPIATIKSRFARFRPVIAAPTKIVCVGLNYRSHIIEMGREFPSHPTLFGKFANTLIGANDNIHLAPASDKIDWEVELAVIIGTDIGPQHRTRPSQAIAGYSIINDITARDWQYRTTQWLQGKTFDHTAPLGPYLVTSDEFDPADHHTISCAVNGDTVQSSTTADLLFSPEELVDYVSSFCTLVPGDVIATGTPGGVGAGRTPPRYLADGDEVMSRIDGIGSMTNICTIAQAVSDGR